MDFRIDLPIYRGPLDLLLFLVRKNELDLGDVALASVVDQYAGYVEMLSELNLTEVGDFVDLAATLIEMKSVSVLPKIEDDEPESIAEVAADDENSDLVRRLLQYKEVRDAAAVMDEMAMRWGRRFARTSDDLPTRRVDLADQPIVDVEIWDLVAAFGRIMREAGGPPPTEVVYDDTPIHVYMHKIHQRLNDHERVALIELVDRGIHKSAVIGWFLATLELTRHHGAAVEQDIHGDVIVVKTNDYSDELTVAEVDNYGAPS